MTRLMTAAACAALALGASTTAFSQSAPLVPGKHKGGFALVTLSGKLFHSKNVIHYTHTGAGTYVIQFNSDVSKCSGTASIARRGQDALLPGYIVVANTDGLDDTLTVSTFATATLVPTDFPFNLTVTC